MKNVKNTAEQKTTFFKKASFPWLLITIALVFGAGTYTGWVLRSQNAAQVTAQASVLAEKLTSKDKAQ